MTEDLKNPVTPDPNGVVVPGTVDPAVVKPAAVVDPAVAAPAVVDPALAAPAPVVDNVVAAAAIKADASVKAAADTLKWYADLPEATHEKLAGFADVDAALAAIEKGVAVNPATTVTEYNIDLGKTDEGVDINTLDDGGSLGRYKEHCLNANISPEVAQGIIDFQKVELDTAEQGLREAGEAHLKKEWGNKLKSNTELGLSTLALLDRMLGGRVGPVAKQQGWAKDPFLVEILHAVGSIVSEDSLGKATPGGGGNDTPVTAEAAYEKLFAEEQKQD